MATLFGKNCAANSGLLGMEPCYVEPGPLLGHILVKGRLTWDVATTTPNKAFFNDLVQQGKAIFLVDAFSAPTEVPAATLETSDITLRSVVVNRGLPMTTSNLLYEQLVFAYTISIKTSQPIQHLAHIAHLTKISMFYIMLNRFVCPGGVVRNMNGMTADGQHGQHIRFERIAHH